MHVLRRLAGAVSVVVGLGSCGSTQNTKEDAKRAFLRWNELAVAQDKRASNYVCRGVKVDDGNQVISPSHPGFAHFKDIVLAFADEEHAEINFHETLDQAGAVSGQVVYLDLVKQSGDWKVCGVQTTAEGGFG